MKLAVRTSSRGGAASNADPAINLSTGGATRKVGPMPQPYEDDETFDDLDFDHFLAQHRSPAKPQPASAAVDHAVLESIGNAAERIARRREERKQQEHEKTLAVLNKQGWIGKRSSMGSKQARSTEVRTHLPFTFKQLRSLGSL